MNATASNPAPARRKYWFLFIGSSIEDLGKKSIRFVVESEVPWTAENRAIGIVRARNKNAAHPLEYTPAQIGWANPSKDIADGLPLCFIPCPRKTMLAMDENNLSPEETAEIISLGM